MLLDRSGGVFASVSQDWSDNDGWLFGWSQSLTKAAAFSSASAKVFARPASNSAPVGCWGVFAQSSVALAIVASASNFLAALFSSNHAKARALTSLGSAGCQSGGFESTSGGWPAPTDAARQTRAATIDTIHGFTLMAVICFSPVEGRE